MNDREDILKEFLLESHENLERLDQNLVALEKDPSNRDQLASIFRTIHTIKGTCGFFGFARLSTVTHAGESLLGRLRDGQLALTAAVVSALLTLVDTVRQMLATIEATGEEGQGDDSALIATLERLQHDATTAPAGPSDSDSTRTSGAAGHQPPLASQEASTSNLSESALRVDVGLLDKLMNLVGELVLTRNRIAQLAANQEETAWIRAAQRLSSITTELQEGVMKARMQPIGGVWHKLPRVVRDVALACGKQVRLWLEGEDTELDRSILEAVRDPLTHLVRNAIDHGIEAPATRQALGKPAEGRLWVRAAHASGQVVIEIGDDGAGINPQTVKRRALEQGLVSPELAGRLDDRALWQLIFLPGLSTAAKVTNVSGRGVGMDVVKTNVERVGGTVELESFLGQGTVVRVRLPLTLAIIPALIVTSGGDRYAIPQASLVEMVRLGEEQARQRVEKVHGVPVYRLRGRLLPLVYLHQELKGAGCPGAGAINIVVLQADDRQFGLVVDRVHDMQDVVVKPLARQLKGARLFAGATILGDGKVVLILDVPALARNARVLATTQDPAPAERESVPEVDGPTRHKLLLCSLPGGRRLAIPLAQVDRLENLPGGIVEQMAGREVIQYRGRILPLIRFAAPQPTPGLAGSLHVVVCSDGARHVGLVVEHILDTTESEVRLEYPTRQPGLAGSAIIGRHVTDVVDLAGLFGSSTDCQWPI